MSKLAFIIAAGGASRRFGGEPKLLRQLDGIPLFCHCLLTFADAAPDAPMVLAAPQELLQRFSQAAQASLPAQLQRRLRIVPGGSSRSESIWHALQHLQASPDGLPELIAIHDAARPYCTAETLAKCLDALAQEAALQGVVASHPCTDTIHTVTAEGIITGTPERATLWCAETPQIFRSNALLDAYLHGDWRTTQPTDDAQLMQLAGHTRIAVIHSTAPNGKITYITDLQ